MLDFICWSRNVKKYECHWIENKFISVNNELNVCTPLDNILRKFYITLSNLTFSFNSLDDLDTNLYTHSAYLFKKKSKSIKTNSKAQHASLMF